MKLALLYQSWSITKWHVNTAHANTEWKRQSSFRDHLHLIIYSFFLKYWKQMLIYHVRLQKQSRLKQNQTTKAEVIYHAAKCWFQPVAPHRSWSVQPDLTVIQQSLNFDSLLTLISFWTKIHFNYQIKYLCLHRCFINFLLHKIKNM